MRETENRPSKKFCYPGSKDQPEGSRMCRDGQVRAALWGASILKGEMSPDEIKDMAQRGEFAINRNADTKKRNLVAHIVYRHARTGDLDEYTNHNGDFLSNNDRVENVFDPKFDRLRKDLMTNGKKGGE